VAPWQHETLATVANDWDVGPWGLQHPINRVVHVGPGARLARGATGRLGYALGSLWAVRRVYTK
jgi:hypothetical protein